MTLIGIETFKTFRRWRTYLGFLAVLGAVILLEVIVKLNLAHFSQAYARGLSNEFVVSGNIINAWAIAAFTLNSLYIHVPFLITLVAGDMVSAEAASGTLRLLLIRPPSRSRIIVAKYSAMMIYTGLLIIFLAALCIGLGLLLFGTGDLIRFQVMPPQMVILPQSIAVPRTLLAFLFAILAMSVVGSLAFLFSTMVDNSIGPIIGAMAIVIVFTIVGTLPFESLEAIRPYLFTTYMDIWQLPLDNPVNWLEVLKYALALIGHDALFFGAAFFIFVRKDIKS